MANYNHLDQKIQTINYINSNQNYQVPNTEDRSYLDYFFTQDTPYKFPHLIICNDPKQEYQNKKICNNYLGIIEDSNKNRFNIRNLNSSGSGLQEGYSRNIDVDSHLKNINYYTNKCETFNYKQ